jgi:uncharacterized protein YgiB involved in biofilm formation
VTLVLIGVAALGGCGGGDDTRRDVYKTREDCLADWSNKPQDCTPATENQHRSRGYYYGPAYSYHSGSPSSWGRSSSTSRSIGTSSSGTSRGGFGSHSSSHSSSSS